jgi:hypothetical protein
VPTLAWNPNIAQGTSQLVIMELLYCLCVPPDTALSSETFVLTRATLRKSSLSRVYKSSVIPRLCKAHHVSYLCYNGSLITWTVISLTAAKFKPLICSLSGFALSSATVPTCSFSWFLWLMPVACAFLYIVVSTLKTWRRVQWQTVYILKAV